MSSSHDWAEDLQRWREPPPSHFAKQNAALPATTEPFEGAVATRPVTEAEEQALIERVKRAEHQSVLYAQRVQGLKILVRDMRSALVDSYGDWRDLFRLGAQVERELAKKELYDDHDD